MSEFKANAANKFNVAEIMGFVIEGEEILWEKEKMLLTSIFSFLVLIGQYL